MMPRYEGWYGRLPMSVSSGDESAEAGLLRNRNKNLLGYLIPLLITFAAISATVYFGLMVNHTFPIKALQSSDETAKESVYLSSENSAKLAEIGNTCDNDFLAYEFSKFILKYHKQYPTLDEYLYRRGIFKQTMEFIEQENSKGNSYTVGMNQFGDMTDKEFKQGYLGLLPKVQSTEIDNSLTLIDASELPESFDWREQNCVTPVKNQGDCGSCWAFGATGALESAFCARYGSLISLSEQQLIDCSFYEGNDGCEGGLLDDAFRYVIDQRGLCTEKGYPYEAEDEKCKDKACNKVDIPITGYKLVPPFDENALAAALYYHSPVAIALDGGDRAFMMYKSGVLSVPCGIELNHGVLITGYGSDSTLNEDYWSVKNSWGPDWGEDGYIRLVRHTEGEEGECGLLSAPVYPIIA